MNKPIYTNTVTHIEADWANLVTTLTYDIFKESVSVEDAREALGIGSLALQSADNVQVSGGLLTNVVIKSSTLALMSGTVETTPIEDNSIVNVKSLRAAIDLALRSLDIKSMARQAANSVNISGGSGKFSTLQVDTAPVEDKDVVNMLALRETVTNAGSPTMALQTPYPAERIDATTYLLPFTVPEGKTMICFVGGIYCFPDQCQLDATRMRIIFNSPIEEELVVGGVFV